MYTIVVVAAASVIVVVIVVCLLLFDNSLLSLIAYIFIWFVLFRGFNSFNLGMLLRYVALAPRQLGFRCRDFVSKRID